jgi:hypothetical protein
MSAMKDGRSNVPAMNAMAEVLGIVPPYLPDVCRAVAELCSLSDEVQSEVERLGDNQPKELLLRWHPKVMEALNALFFQRSRPALTLGAVTDCYGKEDLYSLEYCSATLHSLRGEAVIGHAVLVRIREQISDLLGTLESDTCLDAELRDLLLWNVRAMLRACDSYERRGATGLRDAYNQTIGALTTNPDLVKRRKSSPDTWQKVTVVLTAVATAFNCVTSVITAIEDASAHPSVEKVLIVPELPPAPGSVVMPTSHTAASSNGPR